MLFGFFGFSKHMFAKTTIEIIHVYKCKRNKVSLSDDNPVSPSNDDVTLK